MGNTKGTVHERFVNEPKAPGQNLTRVKCKHCGHSLVEQANRMTGHLKKCHQYQQSLVRKKPTDIIASVHISVDRWSNKWLEENTLAMLEAEVEMTSHVEESSVLQESPSILEIKYLWSYIVVLFISTSRYTYIASSAFFVFPGLLEKRLEETPRKSKPLW